MRLGGRLAAAIDVLDDISNKNRPAADALKDWGRAHRFAGAGDRAAIGNIVYDALRRRRSAAWLMDDDSSRSIAIGVLALEQGMDGEAINAALEGDQFAPAALDQRELDALTTRSLTDAPDAARADCPDHFLDAVQAGFGDEWVDELAALAARPPLDLRVNTLASTRDKALARLQRPDAVPTALASEGIRIPPVEGSGRHPNVQADQAFADGWFEVQDEGSQIVAELTGASAGMQVLDYCAGAGGKTLALSAMMENKGQIFAHDAERHRLAPIHERLRRAGARNVQAAIGASSLEPLHEAMDLVLVDAPCTGSGTWRRRPDAKWRLNDRQLAIRTREQFEILRTACTYVRPGGRMVYITCSIFPEENQQQIEAFLADNPEFAIIDAQELWQERFGDTMDRARFDANGVILSPARTGTDGFFFAAMTRAAA